MEDVLSFIFDLINVRSFKVISITSKQWNSLSKNKVTLLCSPTITYMNMYPNDDWCLYFICKNPDITWNIIFSYPNLSLNQNTIPKITNQK